jgi:hypothetical protein
VENLSFTVKDSSNIAPHLLKKAIDLQVVEERGPVAHWA